MLDFKKVTIEDAKLLSSYYSCCEEESSEYSVGIKCFWNKFYPYEYAISKDGCLVVKYTDGINAVFDMPIPKDVKASIDSTLDEIDEYCVQKYIVPVFSDVPKDKLSSLIQRYNFTKVENYREAEDYVYLKKDLMEFKGKHYSGQRNHIHKFQSIYPNYIFRPLSKDDDLSTFFDTYYERFDKESKSAIEEKQVAKDMARICFGLDNFVSGCIEVDGEIAAITIAELRGNTAIIHIEKALTEYEGIYPVMVSEFLKWLPNSIIWVNREDDSSDKGLRISKMQYRPDHLVSKYVVLIQSELLYVDMVPNIKTQRLTLNEIKEEDASVYNKLCLDDDRNIYWGYDFRDDLEEEYVGKDLPQDYFYQVARKDFEERMCLNLAIRLDDRFIGEVVLYNANYRGSIEIGARIFKEYEGHGYGTEAIKEASEWAIYAAGFRKVVAKCFKENDASYAMLASFMKKTHEDDKFYYFEKNC